MEQKCDKKQQAQASDLVCFGVLQADFGGSKIFLCSKLMLVSSKPSSLCSNPMLACFGALNFPCSKLICLFQADFSVLQAGFSTVRTCFFGFFSVFQAGFSAFQARVFPSLPVGPGPPEGIGWNRSGHESLAVDRWPERRPGDSNFFLFFSSGGVFARGGSVFFVGGEKLVFAFCPFCLVL